MRRLIAFTLAGSLALAIAAPAVAGEGVNVVNFAPASSLTTQTVTLTTACAAGSFIIGTEDMNSSRSMSSITDSVGGNTWSFDTPPASGSSTKTYQVRSHLTNTLPIGATISLTANAAVGPNAIVFDCYPSTLTGFDKTDTQVGTTATPNISFTTLTSQPQWIHVFVSYNSRASGATTPTGWTVVASDVDAVTGTITYEKEVTTTTPAAFSQASLGGTANWEIGYITMTESGAGAANANQGALLKGIP